MAGSLDKYGYFKVYLSRPGEQTAASVHRLVAEAFHGTPPPEKPWALHRDGDPIHNTAGNLYWGDQVDNEQDKLRHGRHRQQAKTHCPSGHPYVPENTYVRPGTTHRQCRTCRKRHAESLRQRSDQEHTTEKEAAA